MFDLRMDLMKKILNLKISYFDRNPVGRVVTRITNDVQALSEFFSSVFIYLFKDIILVIGIVFLMFKINTLLSAVMFALIPSLFYVSYIFRKIVRKAYSDVRKYLAEVNSFVQESFSGIETINIFEKKEDFKKRFNVINKNLLKANLLQVRSFALFRPIVDFHEYIAIALLVFVSGIFIVQGKMTIGSLVAFLSYIRMLFRPIIDLSEKYNILQSALAALERVEEIFKEEEEEKRGVVLHTLKGNIVFDDVWFSYNGRDWVLKGINFDIKEGEKVALVGPTGSGKTSIISLILGLYRNQKGKVLIDGVDIRDLDLEFLRKNIGFVMQENIVFKGTFIENIVLKDKSIKKEKIEEALHRSYLLEVISKYRNGLNERIDKDKLSTGEKQLLAIARIFAFDKKIVILDEATSHIDSYTEFLLQKSIEEVLKDRTGIIIAHRLSTIKYCDRIIVIFKGKIIEEGTHEELRRGDTFYSKLWKIGTEIKV
jgi:ABC-type multidrug transport system fused ATPase/permease subunit